MSATWQGCDGTIEIRVLNTCKNKTGGSGLRIFCLAHPREVCALAPFYPRSCALHGCHVAGCDGTIEIRVLNTCKNKTGGSGLRIFCLAHPREVCALAPFYPRSCALHGCHVAACEGFEPAPVWAGGYDLSANSGHSCPVTREAGPGGAPGGTCDLSFEFCVLSSEIRDPRPEI